MPDKKTKKTTKTVAKKATTKKPTQYADGKQDRVQLAKTVEDLMAIKTRDPFKTTSGEIFDEAVLHMSLSELQEVAVKAGVFPSGTKATLKNKLLKEYGNRTQGRYGHSSTTKTIVDPDSQKAKDILRIINE